jgi:ATP-dependent RNA helicase HelY
VPALGRVRLGKFTDHRSPKVRRDVASALAATGIRPPGRVERGQPAGGDASSVAAEAEIAVLRRAVRAHPVHGCVDRPEHLQWARRWRRLEVENASLADRVATARGSLGQALDRILELLATRGYVRGDRVETPGRVLARIWSESDLVVAECLRRDVWVGLRPAELAATVSVLLFESRRETVGPARSAAGDAAPAVAATVRVWAELAAQERAIGLPITREPDAGFAGAVGAWARGGSLADAMAVSAAGGTDLSAGDFVRWCRQVIDLLDQIAKVGSDAGGAGATPGTAAPSVSAVARSAVAALRRGVVALGTE